MVVSFLMSITNFIIRLMVRFVSRVCKIQCYVKKVYTFRVTFNN